MAVNVEEPVMWEFKWKNEDGKLHQSGKDILISFFFFSFLGEDVHGPYSSEKMLEWQESEFFAAGVWCRYS